MTPTANTHLAAGIEFALIDRLHDHAQRALDDLSSHKPVANDEVRSVDVSSYRLAGRVGRAVFSTSRSNIFRADEAVTQETGNSARKGHKTTKFNIFAYV